MGDTLFSSIIELFSEDFTIVWNEEHPNEIDSLIGKGEVLYFFLISDSNNGITDGTYTYASKWEGNTWKKGGLYIQFNATDEDESSGYDLDGGTVSVKNLSDNNYEFSFNFSTKDGKTVNGFFKGNLKPYIIEI